MSLDRRRFLVVSSLAAAGSLGGVKLLAQQSTPAAAPAQAPPTPLFVPLRNDVGYFTGQGGTIGWLVNREGVVVVDAQMGGAAEACVAGIKERSGDRMVDRLFNTHHHGDHTAGNTAFRPATKKIVAHQNVPALQKKAARPGTEATQVYADATFEKTWEEEFGRERVRATYYGPAHTSGDSIVHFHRANIVHMGDLVFNRRMPVIDRPAGALISGWVTVLETVATTHEKDTLYIFGHAKTGLPPTGSKADLLLQRDFLSALLDRVRADVKAGKSRDEVLKGVTPLEKFPEHGALTERVLGTAWDEVTGALVPGGQ